MIYKNFKLPLTDFISNAGDIPNLKAVILYGSALSGEVTEKSDIDLLLVFDCTHNPETGPESRAAHEIVGKIVKTHDLVQSFSLNFMNLNQQDETNPDFLWEIAKSGILIWGTPSLIATKVISTALAPKILCRYSLKNLKNKDKRNIIRRLYKNKSSLLDEKKDKIAPGVILVEAEKFKQIEKLFSEFNLNIYTVKKIWY